MSFLRCAWVSSLLWPLAVQAQVNCMDDRVAGSYEEQRLSSMLVPDGQPFATQLLKASGFERYGPGFANQLCNAHDFKQAQSLVNTAGVALWQAALDRVQGRRVVGDLPHDDDRMLYWSRLQMTLALRRWQPDFALGEAQRQQLLWAMERASRGQLSLHFPAGPRYKRIIISGFDPFTLGKPGSADTHVRIGNPSGAIALALNGRQIALADGSVAVIQSYLLPVTYAPFRLGMQEHTLLPFMRGPEALKASITISQGGKGEFWVEQWHGRYHATNFADNMGEVIPPLLPAQADADIDPPADTLGYAPQPWQPDKPPQFIASSLPVAAMIGAQTGRDIDNPLTGTRNGFAVLWHTSFAAFEDCNHAAITRFNTQQGGPYPPLETPAVPPAQSCAQSGGGGNYLSNESGYRNVLLRDTWNPHMLAGHLHVPVMTVFGDGPDNRITDALFERYRASIVQQTTRLIDAIAQAL